MSAYGETGIASDAAMTVSSLPSVLPSFVGREDDIATVRALLDDPGMRLLTLTGPGGVGKTRLAIAVAQSAAPEFADGTAFVDLAPVRERSHILPAIAQALGIVVLTAQPLTHTIVTAMRSRHFLLVLDNLEHLLHQLPADLIDVLRGCPRLKTIVTSRVPLRISFEQRFEVRPLEVPALDAATETEAVRLFLQRAHAVRPDMVVDDEVLRTIGEICRRVDGLPLAIELAAARTALMTPTQIVDRLQCRLGLLAKGNRDTSVRHHSLRETIRWSYELLSPDEQRFLRALSVFAGGFTLDAVEAVCSRGGVEDWDTLELLTALVEHSLVRLGAAASAEPRYLMLETIREFAADLLADSGEEGTLRDRHAAWCLSLARSDASAFDPSQHTHRLGRLRPEHANFVAALNWLDQRNRYKDLTELVADLKWLWYLGAHYAEGAQWIDRVLALPYEPAPETLFRLLAHAATLHRTLGSDSATQHVERAREIARDLGDPLMLAEAEFEAGIIAEDTADYDVAESTFRAARMLYAQEEDAWNQAACDYHLGIVAIGRGDSATARQCFESATTAAERMGDMLLPLWCRNYLILLAGQEGDSNLAKALYRQSREVVRVIEDHDRDIFILQGAIVASLETQYQRSTRLAAAAFAVRQGRPFDPPERQIIDGFVALWRERVGEATFETEWRQGFRMRREEVDDEITDVLEDPRVAGGQERSARAGENLFSPRELEVLRHVADGLTNQEIANALFVSRRTVTSHIEHIMTKLDARSRTAVVAWAIRNGVV